MTDKFIVSAKNAVIKTMRVKHQMRISYKSIWVVWYCHMLGNKKQLLLMSPEMGSYYAEVTYDAKTNNVYVDIYLKQSNTVFSEKDLDYEEKASRACAQYCSSGSH